MDEMTEQAIQKRLNHFFASWKYNVDGLFVFSWESDKLLWTKAGYIYEFEIKISRADFKNDFKHKIAKHLILSSAMQEKQEVEPMLFEEFAKQKRKRYPDLSEQYIRDWFNREHDVKDKKMPNYFYYAVPEGLIQPDEVPPYAGLVWFQKECKYGGGIIRKKEAPRLHSTKYKDAELNLGEKFYYNWQTCKKDKQSICELYEDVRNQLAGELAAKGQEMTYDQMKLRMEMAEKLKDDYQQRMNSAIRENLLNNAERKRLRHSIHQMNPDFDFSAIEDEVEKIYGTKQ